jgi:hypothetical protein
MIDELYDLIAEAAERAGRSLSAEISWRLTMSLVFDESIRGIAGSIPASARRRTRLNRQR